MKFGFGKEKNGRTSADRKTEETEMKNTFASKLKELRRERGMGQEQLASVCGVSVQAVSKWECEQSYPDIELLATIADTFGVTIDSLLRADREVEKTADNKLLDAVAEKFGVNKDDIGSVDVHMSTGDAEPSGRAGGLPDDGVLRVVQFLGSRPLSVHELGTDGEKIPLALTGVIGGGDATEIRIEIIGDAELEITDNRDVSVSVTAGGDVNVGDVGKGNDGAVNGSVTAGGDVNCGTVNGPAQAGGDVNCGMVNGSVRAGGDINCGTVNGSVGAGGDVDCGNVTGNVSADGDVSCGNVTGNVKAGADVSCGEVEGDVSAGGDADCGGVAGDGTAGGDVNCEDVEGDVTAGGDVECGGIGGGAFADGEVSCDGSVRIVTGGEKKKRDGYSFDIPDFSGLGEQISRTVNEALERAFGKNGKSDDRDQ